MKNCGICDTKFEPRDRLNKYCSPDCRKEAHRIDARKSAQRINGHKGWGTERKCKQCDKAFDTSIRRTKYCSPECRVAHYRDYHKDYMREYYIKQKEESNVRTTVES